MRAVQSKEEALDFGFTVAGRIAKPVHDVFEAVADPKHLSGYFTAGGAKGRLAAGSTVTWDFHDFPGAFPVHVIEVEQDKKIVLHWAAADGLPEQGGPYETTVTMSFEALEDGRTKVSISESGWRHNRAAQKASYGNCEGWTGMLCALKLYIERGINLREDFYK